MKRIELIFLNSLIIIGCSRCVSCLFFFIHCILFPIPTPFPCSSTHGKPFLTCVMCILMFVCVVKCILFWVPTFLIFRDMVYFVCYMLHITCYIILYIENFFLFLPCFKDLFVSLSIASDCCTVFQRVYP